MLSIRQIDECKLSSEKKLKIVVIGAAGKKGAEYINALMKRSDVEITAVVINKKSSPLIDELQKQGTVVFRDGDVGALVAKTAFDIAVVSVPHAEHDSITQTLLRAGKYIIKEKPLAMTVSQAGCYEAIIKDKKITPIYTTVQRDTLPSFVKAKQDLHLIGKPIKFTYDYWFNLPSVTTGWRAKMATAGGGVILDMGYHTIDVITKFFGLPDILFAAVSYKYPETEQEQLEDFADIKMEYLSSTLQGRLVLDRHAQEKKEIFTIEGVEGRLSVTTQGYQVFSLSGKLIKDVSCPVSKEEEIALIFRHAISHGKNTAAINDAFVRNKQNVEIIEKIYLSKQILKTDVNVLKAGNLNFENSTRASQAGIFAKSTLAKAPSSILPIERSIERKHGI